MLSSLINRQIGHLHQPGVMFTKKAAFAACCINDAGLFAFVFQILNLRQTGRGRGGQQTRFRVAEQLLTGIGNIQITHGQLANTIVR